MTLLRQRVGVAKKSQHTFPHARLTTIPGRDHLTVVPDVRFKEAVVEFLKEQDGA